MEIKRQITGMMRLLSDKTSRVYQRVGTEQDSLTKEPQDRNLTWVHQPAPLSLVSDDHQSNSWSSVGDPGPSPSSTSTPIPNGPGCGQYSTRSKALRILNNAKDLINGNQANDVVPPAVPETPCCMCNCKGTLQAVLQELRAMRRLMQSQKASLERQEQTGSPCQPRLGPGPTPRRRPRKRRPIYKVAPLTVSSTRRAALTPLEASPRIAAPAEPGKREESQKERDSPTASSHPISSEVSVLPPPNNPAAVNNTHSPLLSQLREPQSSESEVRLAEDYDVFISKAQLDSILVNYTRSGSLLFRKLVCAFFDDTTLANSLPNGKRKRGLNDNRKGLDQNIVGAIKVFTEKYCTEHRIEKLPGPRDWVQILQDQIKLARRRLKRDAAEAEEVLNGPSTSMKHTQGQLTHIHYPTHLFSCLLSLCVCTFPLTSVLHLTTSFHQPPSELTAPLPLFTLLSQHTHSHTHTHTHKLMLLACLLVHMSLSCCRCDI
ncbi:BEN domain-containing protein 7 isoform X1 [Lates calcarifer]|uniref:BEN domain-containing protein 7 isoform X1 n=1 Tax=Lates calcarifer TaxID=8187 RepID=A0AAJ7LE08_LATCA|nr:BEN domain-containing protein 7 isoform X1 [Lates calcarifer]